MNACFVREEPTLDERIAKDFAWLEFLTTREVSPMIWSETVMGLKNLKNDLTKVGVL